MKKIRSHVEYGDNGNTMYADLYECELGFYVHINIELDEIHVAHIESNDDNLELWNEIVS